MEVGRRFQVKLIPETLQKGKGVGYLGLMKSGSMRNDRETYKTWDIVT